MASAFRQHLTEIKSALPVRDYGWYPYDSLGALPHICDLIRDDFDELAQVLNEEPALDIGCGDGDFAMLLEHFGASTDAVDHAESNFNQMRGARRLQSALNSGVRIFDIDLDGNFLLPREQYGLAVFLGTLYHLKNPYMVLEEIAKRAAFCLLSTRIAQLTSTSGVNITSEPVAYLLHPRETNNDPTNYWIFSQSGLARLIERTGWIQLSQVRSGRLSASNPFDPDADERVFMLLRSRYRYSYLQVRPLYGWHQVEDDSWRWTTKKFGIEVVLPNGYAPREFALRFNVPEAVLSQVTQVTLRCLISGGNAGSMTCDSPGPVEFRGRFPDRLEFQTIVLAFEVESTFQPRGDSRELGVMVPLLSPPACDAPSPLPHIVGSWQRLTYATGFRSTPIPSISTSTTSPGCMARVEPGVPV